MNTPSTLQVIPSISVSWPENANINCAVVIEPVKVPVPLLVKPFAPTKLSEYVPLTCPRSVTDPDRLNIAEKSIPKGWIVRIPAALNIPGGPVLALRLPVRVKASSGSNGTHCVVVTEASPV